MFGGATIMLGIGPHSNFILTFPIFSVRTADAIYKPLAIDAFDRALHQMHTHYGRERAGRVSAV